MKNVHLIPTDKPSRLYGKNGNYKLDSSTIAMDWYISSAGYKPQNIYITSKEFIEEGDWYLTFTNNEVMGQPRKCEDINWNFSYCKKIILTTDQELISNGVQEIDNEFLEWFIKNPSCEFVKVEGFEPIYGHQNNFTDILYKIIIPQEEPKRKIDTCYNFDKEIGCVQDNCRCEQEEPKQTLEEYEQQGMEKYAHKFKQETLEEAIERLIELNRQDSFYEGAKWQAERMYSEEEVKKIAEEVRWQAIGNPLEFTKNFNKWFEQFKKK